MIRFFMIFLLIFILSGCEKNIPNTIPNNIEVNNTEIKATEKTTPIPITTNIDKNYINENGDTIKERFLLPDGFIRSIPEKDSFGEYLQNSKLKKDGTSVYYYDGREKTSKVHLGVFDMDIGEHDLQQCADAIIRLRAEYFYEKKEYTNIHFNFVSGFNASYDKWKDGYRINVNGNNVTYTKSNSFDDTYETFRKYLNMVFSYSSTLSLEKEMYEINIKEIAIGDVFIKGGSPGHAVIVVDTAINQKGEKIFMIAQSYMPAQNIHILYNTNEKNSPWYTIPTETLETPQWKFTVNDLKRFF